VITNGASEALDLTLRVISRPGARVLLPLPYYYSYPYNVRFAGMVPDYYELKRGKIDYENLLRKLPRAHALLINSPSNPAGSVQDVAVLKNIEKMAARYKVHVISDEIYKDLIYERKNYVLKGPHVHTIHSFSKTFAMCGLRVGYIFSTDEEVVRKVVEMKSHTSMNTNVLAQEMAIKALQAPESLIEKQRNLWRERRDFIYENMVGLGLDLWKPEGAFYVFPKFKHANRVVSDLFYKYKVITYDGAWFGDPARVRFSYALDSKRIKKGLDRVKAFLNKEYLKY
jgi:aspartate aminotransferase